MQTKTAQLLVCTEEEEEEVEEAACEKFTHEHESDIIIAVIVNMNLLKKLSLFRFVIFFKIVEKEMTRWRGYWP